MASASSPNSLGLDFHQLHIQEQSSTTIQQEESTEVPNVPSRGESPRTFPELKGEVKDKKKAYVNPERVKTGGNQRVCWKSNLFHIDILLTAFKDKLSDEELVERMARMREQNEKIKQRRMVFIVH
jgi:hypothetical protein